MDINRWTGTTTEQKPWTGKRRPGRPLTRWYDDIKKAGDNWVTKAQKRSELGELEEAYVQMCTENAGQRKIYLVFGY